MSYTNAEGRQQLLDALGDATDQIAIALQLVGAAYDQLDERAGDRLEEQLFRPVQTAYGRAQRTHAAFAQRYGLPARRFEPAAEHRSRSARAAIEDAVEALHVADEDLGALQDTMLPIEVGDAEVRAGLSEVREAIGPLAGRARELVRTLGR